MSIKIPRPEHPRPQMRRTAWMNLNGEWQYATDRGVSGRARGLAKADSLPEKITVPFCRESKLSGIGDTDFCEAVWYRREVEIPDDWRESGKRVILHIDACDYRTEVWVNGESVGKHVGGYVSFCFDITDKLKDGAQTITVCAEDHVRAHTQPAGKQSARYESYGCFYTRTTGIWQTVWLESVPRDYIRSVKYYPDIVGKRLTVEAKCTAEDGMTVRGEASFEGKSMGVGEATVVGGHAVFEIKLDELYLWELGDGRLYDLKLTLGDDKVESYFGMRSVSIKDGALLLNGKKVFQRLVLDQGFYPDGIYTAPDDYELVSDILRSMYCGFNGARLHQKIFEPRFLYHCDRLGYMVWGEHGNWGLDISRPEAYANFMPEWLEALERDFNHPAIVGWCPLNETQSNQNNDFVRALAALTRAYDPTRLYIDASGWRHVEGVTDMMDWHDYDQNPETFRARYEAVRDGVPITENKRNSYSILPCFISEYGGIRWAPDQDGWGYGEAPKSEEEFIARFKGLADALLDNPAITGLCYTQLTDVEQEVNGLYTYDRRAKFDPAIFKAILTRKAAIEHPFGMQ
ncbi:MAG: beta-galactosidase [Clostridia bacterium]|nr:beta-galactosidase [Clostridia bacterium]